MSDDLILSEALNLMPQETTDLAGLTEEEYLPRIQLYGSSSKPVKRGLIQQGHYGIVRSGNDKIEDLGSTFECFVLAWRPKLMTKVGDGYIVFFDPKSEEFKKHKEEAEVNKTTMFGPEFLLLVPSLNNELFQFFCNNKTMRRSATYLAGIAKGETLKDKGAIISSRLIEAKGYEWHGPQIEKSELITLADCSDPDKLKATIMAEGQKFVNPPKTVVKAEETEEDRER